MSLATPADGAKPAAKPAPAEPESSAASGGGFSIDTSAAKPKTPTAKPITPSAEPKTEAAPGFAINTTSDPKPKATPAKADAPAISVPATAAKTSTPETGAPEIGAPVVPKATAPAASVPKATSPKTTPTAKGKTDKQPGSTSTTGTEVGIFVTGLVALACTVVCFAILWAIHLLLGESYVTNLFLARGWVPYPVTLLAFWAGVMLMFKSRRIRIERQALTLDVLPRSLGDEIRRRNAGDFRSHIASMPAGSRNTLFVSRVERALEHFQARGNVSEVGEVLRSQADIDAGNVESSFTMIKVFIWAIPILGFIGTVLGISFAVAEFSGVISQGGDVPEITKSLGGVTNGLALAFETTLLALIMSMCVMFPTSSIQQSEENLISSVDEFCIDTLLPRLQDGKHDGASNADEIREAVSEALKDQDKQFLMWKDNLQTIGEHLNQQVASGMGDVFDRIRADYQEQMEAVNQKAASERQALVMEVTEAQQKQYEQLATNISTMQSLATDLQDRIGSSQQEQVTALGQTVETIRSLATETQQQIATAQTSQAEQLAKTVETIRSLTSEMQEQISSTQKTQTEQLTQTVNTVRSLTSEAQESIASAQRDQAAGVAEVRRQQEEQLQTTISALRDQTAENEKKQMEQATSMIEALKSQASEAHEKMAQFQQKQIEQIGALQQKPAEKLAETVETIRSLAVELQQKITTMQSDQVDQIQTAMKSMSEFSTSAGEQLSAAKQGQLEELTAAQSQFAESVAAFAELVKGRQDLAAMQQSLNENLQALQSTGGLSDSLAGIDKNMSQLTSIMERIDSQPAGGNGGWFGWGKKAK